MLRLSRRRSLIAATVAFALVLPTAAPSALITAQDSSAVAMLDASCATTPGARASRELKNVLAQVPAAESPEPLPVTAAPDSEPTTTPSPSPSPSAYPDVRLPSAPSGPQTLQAPPPSPLVSPFPSAAPIPTETPTVEPSGPVFLVHPTASPSPTPSVSPTATIGPIVLPTATPSPPAPSAAPTLGPNQYAVLANQLIGSGAAGQPLDAIGDVNLFFADGVVVGDRAHYDGTRYIDVSGHAYIKERDNDEILRADVIRFDTLTQRAYLSHSSGETSQGVEQGKLYFNAERLQSTRGGVVHGENANITTCPPGHNGYHIRSKTIDVTPGERAVLRAATIFLGPLAIFYLPIVVIPLDRTPSERRREASGLIPVIGYDQTEGVYVKARIPFGSSDQYYGYYRLDAYSKLGIGFGYVAFFRRKDNKRAVDVDFYRFKNSQDASDQNNLNINDTENFSKTLKSQISLQYLGNYGPGITLPPSFTLNGTVQHTTERTSQTYTFQHATTGNEDSSFDIGFVDQRQITQRLSQGINLSFTNSSNSFVGETLTNSSFHVNTLTNYTSPGVDYSLTFDKTLSQDVTGVNRLPELMIKPHQLFHDFPLFPITSTVTLGQYTEPSSQLTATRGQALVNFGPAIAHFLGSDFSATVNVTQDAYSTGDLKAQIQQNASLTTPVSNHFVNTLTYNEQNSNGPAFEPFKTLDNLSGASHGAQDVVRLFNQNFYTLTLSSGTNFNEQAQPISYQLTTRPSPRSSLAIAGSYVPGPGNGFLTTNLQAITPFGYESDLEFTTNVDWKNKGRLESKNVYYRRIIDECYEITASYNQDLRQFNLGFQLLAFPSRSASFGIGQTGPIVPQSFNF